MANIFSIVLLLVLAGFFIFLAARSLRARRLWVKWPGLILSGLLALIFLAVTAVALLGFYRLNIAPHKYAVSDIQVSMTPENVARGERLAYICSDCHASAKGSLPLDGLDLLAATADAPPIGTLIGTNLTPGGPLADWSDGEIIRAIREGVDKDGKPLFVMPSIAFRHMSDEDVQALVAYLRSQPAVENDLPDQDLNILGALFVGLGQFSSSAQAPITGPVAAPPKGTAEYGDYLVRAFGCEDCHGPDLDGQAGLMGPGVNLTLIVPNWTADQFIQLFRSGTSPITGRKIEPEAMPWMAYEEAFSDEELRDIYTYLHSLEPVASPVQ